MPANDSNQEIKPGSLAPLNGNQAGIVAAAEVVHSGGLKFTNALAAKMAPAQSNQPAKPSSTPGTPRPPSGSSH